MLKIVKTSNQNEKASGAALVAPPQPWEDSARFKDLKAAVFGQLQPVGLQQEMLATDILDCIWEQFRYRGLSNSLSRHTFRKAAIMLLNNQDPLAAAVAAASPGHDIADQLLSADADVRAAALEKLALSGVDEDDIKAAGFLAHVHENELLHRRVIQLSDRRRALLREFEDLKALETSKNAVEDAVVID